MHAGLGSRRRHGVCSPLALACLVNARLASDLCPMQGDEWLLRRPYVPGVTQPARGAYRAATLARFVAAKSRLVKEPRLDRPAAPSSARG